MFFVHIQSISRHLRMDVSINPVVVTMCWLLLYLMIKNELKYYSCINWI